MKWKVMGYRILMVMKGTEKTQESQEPKVIEVLFIFIFLHTPIFETVLLVS